jgi:hypothetical protein
VRKADAAQKVLKAGVRAERVEAGPDQDAGVNSLVETLFPPSHGLIFISKDA